MPGVAAPPGSPVPTTGPTATLKRIASFRPGVWNGVPVSRQDLQDLVANFGKYSVGTDPWHAAYVSLNHDDGLSFDRVSKAELDKDGTLYLDAENIPAEVKEWINGGRLQAPSVEFWEPGDFPLPDGSLNTTRVLKCLTLLGNQPPAVKGLGPLPVAKFSHRGPARKFSGRYGMDRQAMIAALQAAGVDTTLITEAVPDALLDAILKAIQATTQKPAEGAGDGTQQMADATGTGTGTAGVAGAGAAGATGSTGSAQPTAVTIKFADAAGKPRTGTLQEYVDYHQGQLNTLRANSAALTRVQSDQLQAVKRAKIKAFRDQMTGNVNGRAFMTPVEFDAIEPLLLGADDVAVRKFADGKTTGSALDEACARIKAAHPTPVRTFGDKAPDPQRGGAGGQSALSPEAKRAMLQATPLGRAALANAAKK